VVLDEVVGMLLALLWLKPAWPVCLAGFALFRVFDILKPWPARPAERLRGGLGIMLDDVIAGLYAGRSSRPAFASSISGGRRPEDKQGRGPARPRAVSFFPCIFWSISYH